MDNYKVLSFELKKDLEDNVNESIRNGYKPIGGIFVEHCEDEPLMFHQAIYKPNND